MTFYVEQLEEVFWEVWDGKVGKQWGIFLGYFVYGKIIASKISRKY